MPATTPEVGKSDVTVNAVRVNGRVPDGRELAKAPAARYPSVETFAAELMQAARAADVPERDSDFMPQETIARVLRAGRPVSQPPAADAAVREAAGLVAPRSEYLIRRAQI